MKLHYEINYKMPFLILLLIVGLFIGFNLSKKFIGNSNKDFDRMYESFGRERVLNFVLSARRNKRAYDNGILKVFYTARELGEVQLGTTTLIIKE